MTVNVCEAVPEVPTARVGKAPLGSTTRGEATERPMPRVPRAPAMVAGDAVWVVTANARGEPLVRVRTRVGAMFPDGDSPTSAPSRVTEVSPGARIRK